MIKILLEKSDKQIETLVVIPDECGDSMWDKVLAQDAKSFNLQDGENESPASTKNEVEIKRAVKN